MGNINDRIKELRVKNSLTQSELAQRVGLTYIQIGRYEKGKSSPSADVLGKLADALGVSADFLMNGESDKVQQQLSDLELIQQFKEVEALSSEDKHLVKVFIDAFLTKKKLQKLAL